MTVAHERAAARLRGGEPAELMVRGARLSTPAEDLDAERDLVVRGRDRRIGGAGRAPVAEGAEEVEAAGMLALPAFVDPHVHLRVPGQEHKEDIETGTRAAGAGGYCAVLAMGDT